MALVEYNAVQETAARAKVRASDKMPLRERFKRTWPAYLFILPGMLLFVVWSFYPLLNSFIMSFAEWNLIKPSVFVGLDNYTRALGDPLFWSSLGNTVFYTVVTVPGQMILGLAVALLLDAPLRAKGFFRTVYYIPVVTSWVVVSLVFTYLFNGQAGLVNWVLHDVLHVIGDNVNWLGDPFTANIAIASLGIYKGLGWTADDLPGGATVCAHRAIRSSLYRRGNRLAALALHHDAPDSSDDPVPAGHIDHRWLPGLHLRIRHDGRRSCTPH